MPISLRDNVIASNRLPLDNDVLMDRAELLEQRDRELLRAVFVHGQSAEALARMMKVHPRSLRAKVHRLSRRLVSREFLRTARAIPYLPEEDAKLAKLAYCEGVSQRRLLRRMGLKSHSLRRRLIGIAAQIETIHRLSRDGQLLAGQDTSEAFRRLLDWRRGRRDGEMQ
jgi:DNA-directed RNA polymerase specialized sigma24 family protein